MTRAGQRVEFAPGALGALPSILAGLGADRVFVVTDAGLRAVGILDRVLDLLKAPAPRTAPVGLRTAVFDAVRANPTTQDLDGAADAVRALAPSAGSSTGRCVVLAVGGGSVLDAAKGIALLATNACRAVDLHCRDLPPVPGLAVVAVPTTAGTGAETNGFGVVEHTDPVSAVTTKVYIGHDSVRPQVAVLDPELTVGLPPAVTAATGIDALVHGVESLASRGATAHSAQFAREAVGLVARWLPVAVADGTDLRARSQLLLGAHCAGQALTLSGLGLVHGIGHSLTNHFHTPHGVALAAVLPEVMTFYLAADQDPDGGVDGRADDGRVDDGRGAATRAAYAVVAEAMAAGSHPTAAVEAVTELAVSVGVRKPLRELGLTGQAVPSVARGAVEDVVSANGPRAALYRDVQQLLEAAL